MPAPVEGRDRSHGHLAPGHALIVVRTHERALDAGPSDGSGDQSVLARALYSAGKTAEHQGDYTSARQRLTRSAHLFRQLGNRELLAM